MVLSRLHFLYLFLPMLTSLPLWDCISICSFRLCVSRKEGIRPNSEATCRRFISFTAEGIRKRRNLFQSTLLLYTGICVTLAGKLPYSESVASYLFLAAVYR